MADTIAVKEKDKYLRMSTNIRLNKMKETKKTHRQPTTDQRWLSIENVVPRYGLSISTQQRMRKDGTLPYSKTGRVIRYDRLKIDAMFEQHEVSV